MTGADLTDPLLGSDYVPDDGEVWRQKFNSRMKISVLEQRDFLFPRSDIGMKPAYNSKKHGPCFQFEWEIRPIWVLQVMLNDPDYVYSKRIIYVDATPVDQGGNFPLCWGEHYDQKGRLFKVSSMFTTNNKEGFRNPSSVVYMNYLTDHFTIMDIDPPNIREDFHKVFPLKEEVFTIKGLLKRAR